MMDTRILIIGGGAAGLSTAGALKRRGIDSLILERNPHIGDVWAQRYDRLRLHTVSSSIAHYPLPRHYPTYPTKDQYAAYLRAYAQHFKLASVTGCTVHHVKPSDDSARPGWLVASDCGAWHASVVVLATGQYGVPVLPEWPGRAEFAGPFMHAAAYRNARPYLGKRVLVIGSGNSGAEIAADLAEQGAAFVAISIRTQPPIVPRDSFGIPVQRSSFVLSRLPPQLADRIASTVARLVLGNLRRYGVRPAAWGPYSTQRVPVIDAGFVAQLKSGRIVARPTIARFTRTGVVFADGRMDEVDAVIAATGYRSGLKELLDLPGALDTHDEPRFASGQPTAFPGLYFIGYTHSLLGHLYQVNCDSRQLARHVQAYMHALPYTPR